MKYPGLTLVLLVAALSGGCARSATDATPPTVPVSPSQLATGSTVPTSRPAPTANVPSSAPVPSGNMVTTGPAPGGGPSATPLPDLGPYGRGSVPWTLVGRGARSTDVIVSVAGLACRPVLGAHVDETATAVTIAVLAGTTPPGLCRDVDSVATVLVRAPEPIGSRTIEHAQLSR
jgi:hypothetical protein